MSATIRSRSNALLRRVGAVIAGKDADSLVLEGERLVEDALRAGLALEAVLVAEPLAVLVERWSGQATVRLVDERLLARTSTLETPPGVIAVCPRPSPANLVELPAGPRSLVLVAAGIGDPGNLGALARSAEAAGADALVVTRNSASPWSTKALRGSMGSLLRLPCCHGVDPNEAAASFAARGFRGVRAATRGGAPPERMDWSGPLALWIGSETGALPAPARSLEAVTIPCALGVESLNVTVAASLLLFAAGRVTSEAVSGDD
ncbi:MAG: RNA methyltransferase [Planctomycetota bacterium]|jgi:TrmH family RNA methyltransferase|nr:RNA methyltransferase [Planctomycetota bacterium]MDP6762050.1 RNA methyltransferase [Planctomycetota bacterium]MDP6989149.1 RNA methyltransferase [Planctomycetota bacterium]